VMPVGDFGSERFSLCFIVLALAIFVVPDNSKICKYSICERYSRDNVQSFAEKRK
jgi:hypothetical protein